MLSLTAGNVSSALGGTILAALAEYVVTFKLIYHMTFCGVHWN
jgi:hypothetical protein